MLEKKKKESKIEIRNITISSNEVNFFSSDNHFSKLLANIKQTNLKLTSKL